MRIKCQQDFIYKKLSGIIATPQKDNVTFDAKKLTSFPTTEKSISQCTPAR